MKQFLKYFLAVLLALVVIGVIKLCLFFSFLGALTALSAPAVPHVEDHSVYQLELKGSISERQNEDALTQSLFSLMGDEYDSPMGLDEMKKTIRYAKDCESIDGICLRLSSFQCGYATAYEIREALKDFRASGKWVVAYADHYSQRGYYIASVADRLMLNPAGSIAWQGMGATLEYYARLMQKLGVKMQVMKVGRFKSAVEPYLLTSMSEENRAQYRLMLGEMWEQVRADVAESRHLSEEQVDALAARYMATEDPAAYLTEGMADTLCYAQDVEAYLRLQCGKEKLSLLSYQDLCALLEEPLPQTSKVALLYAEGNITDEKGDGIVGKKLVKEIDKLREDKEVKAVVLRINSGGGSAYASEQIHHALSLLKAEKPLVVSMGDYAASGGYYMACPAHYIFAEPTTLTGSIGIFGLVPCVEGLMDKVGLDIDTVRTHPFANMDQTMVMSGMSEEEMRKMQVSIERGYDLFTRRCAEGRGMTQDAIKQIAEGHVWSGKHAITIGLVDSLGGMEEAICKAVELAQLDTYQLVAYPKPQTTWELLMSSMSVSAWTERVLSRVMGEELYRTMQMREALSEQPSIQAIEMVKIN